MTGHTFSQEMLEMHHLVRAIELALRLGDSGAAWRAAHALWRAFPAAIMPQVWLGQALLDAGNATVAIDYFRRALRINPLDAAAWAGLAGALARIGQEGAAAAALSRAALHDPLAPSPSPPASLPNRLLPVKASNTSGAVSSNWLPMNWRLHWRGIPAAPTCDSTMSRHCGAVAILPVRSASLLSAMRIIYRRSLYVQRSMRMIRPRECAAHATTRMDA
jgi:hypothetical protein